MTLRLRGHLWSFLRDHRDRSWGSERAILPIKLCGVTMSGPRNGLHPRRREIDRPLLFWPVGIISQQMSHTIYASLHGFHLLTVTWLMVIAPAIIFLLGAFDPPSRRPDGGE